MVERKSLRLSATLLLVGLIFTVVVGLFHDDRAPANDHVRSFTNYANSGVWTAVHFGQFVAMAIVVAGLLIPLLAVNDRARSSGWVSRFGAVSAVISLAIYGVLQGLDGVALKQASVAWLNAPEAEKAARFASAEAIRWLEWGFRSYFSFMLGLSFILFAAFLSLSASASRWIGALIGLTGAAYLVQGWVIGSQGFSNNNTLPTLSGYLLWLVWSIGLLIFASRMKAPAVAAAGGRLDVQQAFDDPGTLL